ncbi:MAG: transcriptional repressor [Oscillospiraceae bacterium]|nr:transcriptional repressor [Oscillospiraceae bacterium]
MKKEKFSSQRHAIYSELLQSREHPSARLIYEKLRPSYNNLSLGTVYRNIALFKEQGSIISVCSIGGEERYDGNIKPHAHCICKQCGKITDIFDDAIETLSSSIANSGFTPETVTLNYYGYCSEHAEGI